MSPRIRLNTKTIFGGEHKKQSTFSKPPAAASLFYDYDNDGWLDLFS